MVPAVTFDTHQQIHEYKGDFTQLDYIDQEQSLGLDSSNAFEGPEKLLEIWVSPAGVCEDGINLREIPLKDIEEMLDLVSCKILSRVISSDMDAYLLSESSLFVFKHKIILKTCGTTTTLFCLDKLEESIRLLKPGFSFKENTYRIFYSRRAFMFPSKQDKVHRSWQSEVSFLNRYFNPESFEEETLGELNGDHWYIYINGNDDIEGSGSLENATSDVTVEMLMTDLDASTASQFYQPDSSEDADGHKLGSAMMRKAQLDRIYPRQELEQESATTVKHDSFAFMPCGYSSNTLLGDEHYYTLHITPEAGWSYASFESSMADLGAVGRVAELMSPGKFVLTVCREDATAHSDAPSVPGYVCTQQHRRRMKWYLVDYYTFRAERL